MGTHRTVVCLGAVTGFLTVVCIALAGVLIWREVFTDTEPERDPKFIFVNTTNLTEVRVKFPGYFKTPREQESLIMANDNHPQPVLNTSRVYKRCFSNGYCERVPEVKPIFPNVTTTTTAYETNNPEGLNRRRRRQVTSSPDCLLDVYDEDDLTFHGCCISYANLEPRATLPTAEPGRTGDTVIAQFPGLKQYFEIQYCCQAQSCTGCQCAQTYYVISAVVPQVGSGGFYFGTEYVRVPGCCKCLNTTPEEEEETAE